MSKLISIRDDLYEKLKELKVEEKSFSDVVQNLFDALDGVNIKMELLEEEHKKFIDSLKETTVTQEGRISKTLAGKTILYKVKDD